MHPLHGIASLAPAAAGILRLYQAIDCLAGEFTNAFPDATVLLFSMHEMGPNTADIPSMVLLTELLYRDAFSGAYLRPFPGQVTCLAASRF